MTPQLIIALDTPDLAPALGLAHRLSGLDCWFKVGLELFCAQGTRALITLKERGHRVFLDLKYFDIPNTVRGAVASATRLGADMLTLHLLGGQRMAEAAREGREAAAGPGATGPLLMGVTVLTSVDPAELPGGDPQAAVRSLALHARDWYLDGVVCSGLEAAGVKAACGPLLACLTPGIRPASGPAAADDQRRVVTPAEAVRAGADYLVVGRPVTGAEDPAAAARAILDEMHRASEGDDRG
ncbi:MAG: orotidine-5'-phosphate decarboxylase [Desulfovibrionaceae bacterium]